MQQNFRVCGGSHRGRFYVLDHMSGKEEKRGERPEGAGRRIPSFRLPSRRGGFSIRHCPSLRCKERIRPMSLLVLPRITAGFFA